MSIIAPPKKPHAAEAELSLLPEPAPIEPPPIPEPEPPPVPWHEDLEAHPEHRPSGNPWMRGPDGTYWMRGDLRQGLHWLALEPSVGEPGVWRRSKRPPVAYDHARGLQMALDGAQPYQSTLDRNPPPDALEAELRALELTSPAIATAQRAQLGRPDTRSSRKPGDAFDPGQVTYDRRLVGMGVNLLPMLAKHLQGPPPGTVEPTAFDAFCPCFTGADTLNLMAIRAGNGMVVSDHSQFVPGRGTERVRIFTTLENGSASTYVCWVH
jgi:hypothetical protein